MEQKGSLVTPERLRFDFSHFQPMTSEEIKKVEEIVNQEISLSLPVQTDIMSLDEARNSGAMALFDEKYGEKVRVVSMGDFSKELCGGTHVRSTSDISWFRIIGESGIAAGVRRIEAVTGRNVIRYLEDEEKILLDAASSAKVAPSDLVTHIGKMSAEIRRLRRENESLKSAAAAEQVGNIEDSVTEVCGVRLLAARVKDLDGSRIRELGDQMRDKIHEGVIVLVSDFEGKVSLLVMATDSAQKAGAHAGDLVKEAAGYIGGRGGGRPGMAQAGGKDASGIEKLLEAVPEILSRQLS